jgi:hypothetical protein
MHSDFDALLRAQVSPCTAIEYCQVGCGSEGMLLTRSAPDARSDCTDAVQHWWSHSRGLSTDSAANMGEFKACTATRTIPGLIYSRASPSGQFVAIFRKGTPNATGEGKDSCTLEIRSHSGTVLCTTALSKVHGDVLSSSWFGGACWSMDESCLYYTAEEKRADPKHFWESADSQRADASATTEPAAGSDPVPNSGNKFDFVDDWGEQNSGIAQPRIFRVEPWSGAAPVLVPVPPQLADRLGWGQPQVTPDGQWLLVTAWASHPRRLGSIYCMQRPSGIYALHLAQWISSCKAPPACTPAGKAPLIHCRAVLISAGEVQARSARLSPDGRKLVYLGRDGHAAPGDSEHNAHPEQPGILRTHNGGFALRGFSMGAWLQNQSPGGGVTFPGPPPQSDLGAPATAANTGGDLLPVVYKQGLLPVLEEAPLVYCSTLLPVVDVPGEGGGDGTAPLPPMHGLEGSFPGVYCTALPRHTWKGDSSALVFSTAWGSCMVVMALQMQGGGLSPDGGVGALTCQTVATSLAARLAGTGDPLPSPQQVLQRSLREAGALATPPPATPFPPTPTPPPPLRGRVLFEVRFGVVFVRYVLRKHK